LISLGIIPVFSAITHDNKGQLLNTNADTIASEIAISLSTIFEVSLIYCFEKQGVLADSEDENSVIQQINEQDYVRLLKNKAIHSGMIPKMDNCFYALKNGVNRVILGNPSVVSNKNGIFTTLKL
jgi:acetylglutamate kinase